MQKAISFLLVACSAATVLAREQYQRDFVKALPLAAGRGFRIENSNGNIVVHGTAGGQVQVRAEIRCSANTASEARGFCDQIQIAVEESATGPSVRTVYPKTWSHNNLGYSVNYDISMPEGAPIEVRNRFGAVSIVNLRAPAIVNNSNGRVSLTAGRGRQQIDNSFGEVDVRTNEGDLVVRNGNGAVTAAEITGAVEIANRFGGVRVSNAGSGVTIRNNNGAVVAEGVSGPANVTTSFAQVTVNDAKGDVTVENQNGEVRAAGVGGIADIRTTFARVTCSRIAKSLTVRGNNTSVVGDAVGGNATVETSFGSVELRGVKGGARVTSGNSAIRLNDIAGEVYARTSFGGVTLSEVSGPVTVENQNGSVTVQAAGGKTCRPISLRTSFGPIRVTLPADLGYNVTAHTTFGRIHSEHQMTVSGDLSPESVTGKIGSGGCELRLADQNGGIDILK